MEITREALDRRLGLRDLEEDFSLFFLETLDACAVVDDLFGDEGLVALPERGTAEELLVGVAHVIEEEDELLEVGEGV